MSTIEIRFTESKMAGIPLMIKQPEKNWIQGIIDEIVESRKQIDREICKYSGVPRGNIE